MQYKQGTGIVDGAEGAVSFPFPRDHWLACVQIQDEHTYPLYVRVEYYINNAEEFPVILFNGFVRANSTYYNSPAIALNFPVDAEKGIIKVNMLNESGATVTPIISIQYYDKATHLVPYYNAKEQRGIWAYDDLIERHTSAGVIDINIQPPAGSWFELSYLHLTAGFTGAETVTVELLDTALGLIKLLGEVSTTTGTIELPILATSEEDNTASTASSVGKLEDNLRITYPDSLNISVTSTAATDDINVRLRARLKDQIPTITLGTNNQSQAGYVNEYSQVI